MEKKMIDLTVRTLDSQNHPFTVEDDITVAQFKQHIAETVNIPPETQRIIFCGRVLSDETKLNEYDINGKVVHLVERAPPSENRQNNANRPRTPPTPQNVIGGNAMYFGSMTFPLEPQNLIPPPPSHSLAASRLNVARRMLRRAEFIINVLENPTRMQPVQTEEPQEEVTPVFEARVIVPATSNDPIDRAFVLNAVHNSIINSVSDSSPAQQTSNGDAAAPALSTAASTTPTTTTSDSQESAQACVQTSSGDSGQAAADSLQEPSPTATAATTTTSSNKENVPPRRENPTSDDFSPTTTSTDDETERNANNTTSATMHDNISRTTEMAELLDTLGRLQTRFAPFLENYQNFMREDPVVEREEVRRAQAMMNRVSEVLHYLGHAYHSLSDIIITVRDPPARPLLCRPILLQHTAVVPTGFPIQVEAQINFTPDNNPTPTTTTTTNNETSQTNTTTTTTPATSVPTSTASNNSRGMNTPNITVNPNIMIPLMPSTGVHALSFPIGIRSMRSNSGTTPPSQATTNNRSDTANATTNSSSSPGGNTTASGANASSFNNPNLEFFMEVTPESITIDSLETTLLGGGNTVRAGAPPPELIQSIVQMASQLVNRGASTSNLTSQNLQSPQTQSEATTQNNTTGQNSLPRGNTQTNPTTSTSTRSTARPHVHLAQHAMQGFDPFLPCNSHHLRRRRFGRTTNNNNSQPHDQAQQQQQQSNARQAPGNARNGNGNANNLNPVFNVVQGVLNSLQTVRMRRPTTQSGNTNQQTASATPTSVPNNQQAARDLNQLFSNLPNISILPHIQNAFNGDFNARGPTIAQLLHQTEEQPDAGIFNDLMLLLSRNVTISDILQINSERLDPLVRIGGTIRRFVTTRILEGNATPSNIERGVNRLLDEFQPFIENLSHLPVHDNIDIIRSTQMLFRMRLPNIIKLAAYLTPDLVRPLVEQIKITFQHLCALILHSSGNGQRGVEEVLGHMVQRYMEETSPEIQEWSLLATRIQVQQFMRQLNIPTSDLQPYIVRTVDSVTSPQVPQPMELDTMHNEIERNEQAGSSAAVLGVINLDGDSDLPTVVLGSETWHNQVPSDWVPIITRDSQRQRRQNQQSPLSDAYLSGMPSKRRKIVSHSKPQGSLPQVISESIKRAVTSTGLSSVGNLDTVAQEAAADLNIQSAYKELLRSRVQSSVQNNEDFTPDRFPNASNYFNKSQ